MGSLQKLITFFKENLHDVVDYWYLENRIKWIKIISRKGGEIYLINVYSYKLGMEESEEYIGRKSRFRLIETTPQNNFEGLWKHFQNNKNRLVLINGNEISESENSFYTATNLPKMNNLGFYLIIELEWFYENVFIVNHEINRCYSEIFSKINQSVRDLMKTSKSFLKDDTQLNKAVAKLLVKSGTFRKTNLQSKALYQKVCSDETDNHVKLFRLDNAIDPNTMTFKASVERQYNRKKIVHKIEKLDVIRSSLVQQINYTFVMEWNYLLQVLIITNNITKLMESILFIILDAERK